MRRVFLTFYLFVVIVLAAIYLLSIPVESWLYSKIFKKFDVLYTRQLTKGEFFLLESRLRQYDESEWEAHLKEIRKNFGFDINLYNLDELEFNEEEQAELYKGINIVKEEGYYVYRLIDSSNKVLVLGPFPDYEDIVDTTVLQAGFWIALLIFVALLSLLWGLPFWKNLKALMTSAERFGKGDFSSRSKLTRYSALQPMADSFNGMADRITQLIDSHKMLLNAVSHELRTPIARMRFELEMLEGEAEESKEYYLKEISRDIDELDDLVAELLTYIRFDRERPELIWEEIPWSEWIANVINKTVCDKNELHLRAKTKKSPKFILGDARFLVRLMDNLLSNAVRYAENHVYVSLERKSGFQVLSVSDDGPGIPEGDRLRVFNPFVRLDKSRSRQSGGYGLGLAIVKQIMDWHGGSVRVEPAPSGGARFVCRWPVEGPGNQTDS